MPATAMRQANPVDGFATAEATFAGLVRDLHSAETARMSHSDLEALLEREGRELMRQLLQAHLDLRAEAKAAGPVVGADGVARTHARAGARTLETLLGTVQVTREGHGARERETLFPLDAELNLPPELYSFGIRRRAAEEATKGSFDEVVKVLATHSGAAVAKRQVEEVVRRAAQDFDRFYFDRRLTWPAETGSSSDVLVLTFDGKGVPMRHADLRPATQAAATRRQRTLATRLTKGEKRHTRRMAQVAAVYTTAPFARTAEDIIRELGPPDAPRPTRPHPEGKRVWASLTKEPAEVIEEAFLDASSRDPKRTKRWVVLVDGNADQLGRVRSAAKRLGVTVTIVLDLIHVLEYLWKAAYVFHPEGSPEAEAWVTERLLWLLCGDVGQVIASIRRTATRRRLRRAARRPADTCADYLERHRAYVRYDTYLADGFPIATGVIEGACRHLIRDRLAITGARWSLAGAEAILRLRSLRASGDWDAYWRHHEQKERERNHAARYANGAIPQLTPPESPSRRTGKAPRLRVVK
ncbi:MAG: ISKra4 family transposase [Acidobacteria bacterium]|nr:ISKra4 family transposase [Acidobacteriota bacterium]